MSEEEYPWPDLGPPAVLTGARSESLLCSWEVRMVLVPRVELIMLDRLGRREPEMGLLCCISLLTWKLLEKLDDREMIRVIHSESFKMSVVPMFNYE